MPKKLAHKGTRKLMMDNQIKESGYDKQDFTDSWKGKIVILNPEESEIAQKINIKEKGEFALKA